MHEVLVNRLGGLSLPRKSVVRLTDRPNITLDVYRGRKTTTIQHILTFLLSLIQEGQLSVSGESMCSKLINRLGCLSLPRKSVVRLTDRPDMTLDVYRGRKQHQHTNTTRSRLA